MKRKPCGFHEAPALRARRENGSRFCSFFIFLFKQAGGSSVCPFCRISCKERPVTGEAKEVRPCGKNSGKAPDGQSCPRHAPMPKRQRLHPARRQRRRTRPAKQQRCPLQPKRRRLHPARRQRRRTRPTKQVRAPDTRTGRAQSVFPLPAAGKRRRGYSGAAGSPWCG